MNETHDENDEEENCLNCYQQHMNQRRQNPISVMKGLCKSSTRALALLVQQQQTREKSSKKKKMFCANAWDHRWMKIEMNEWKVKEKLI